MFASRFALILVFTFTFLATNPLLADVILEDDATLDATHAYIGKNGYGTMTIDNSSNVTNSCSYIAYLSGSSGEVTVDGANSAWHSNTILVVGSTGHGTLNITNGGTAYTNYFDIATCIGSFGETTIDGINSTLNCGDYSVIGDEGNGTLNIIKGGVVNSHHATIAYMNTASGKVFVDGIGSTWNIDNDLKITEAGNGTLAITNGGLVRIANELTMVGASSSANGTVRISSGGMLALAGNAGDSLEDFYSLILGTGEIQWWDGSIGENGDWTPLNASTATLGDDYTLEYITEGDLTGYTLLTVGTVPEPTTLAMVIMSVLTLVGFSRLRKQRD